MTEEVAEDPEGKGGGRAVSDCGKRPRGLQQRLGKGEGPWWGCLRPKTHLSAVGPRDECRGAPGMNTA